jgi:hypothetical protein
MVSLLTRKRLRRLRLGDAAQGSRKYQHDNAAGGANGRVQGPEADRRHLLVVGPDPADQVVRDEQGKERRPHHRRVNLRRSDPRDEREQGRPEEHESDSFQGAIQHGPEPMNEPGRERDRGDKDQICGCANE